MNDFNLARWKVGRVMENFNKNTLVSLFNELEKELGKRPTKKDWIDSNLTPSDMPVRQNFGNWNNFIEYMGLSILKPEISSLARDNLIKSRKGKKGGNNKGGKHKRKNGYIDIWIPEHPNSRKSGYIAEHRYIMSQHIGRPLRKDEIVHHINENKSDNRIENLQIMTTEEHTRLHTKGNEDRFVRKGSTQCIYPECNEVTSSKYKLCTKHYKIQWQRLKKGSINNIQDTDYSWEGHTQETKENLRNLTKEQNRKNGKFSK